MPAAARRASSSTCPRRIRPASKPSSRPVRCAGLDLSLAGSYVSAEFDLTIDNPVLASRTGIREGNRLPTVPKFQIAASATYGTRLSDNADWYVNTSFPACRRSHYPAGRSGAGRRNLCRRRQWFPVVRPGHWPCRERRCELPLEAGPACLQFGQLLARREVGQRSRGRRATSTTSLTRTRSCRSTASAGGVPASVTTSGRRG